MAIKCAHDGELLDSRRALELWGGIEATINRVGDHYFDQLKTSGHYQRLDDLRLIAQTGIKALRYPILWERHAQEPVDWEWAAQRLDLIRSLAIQPIVGLLHHGSGPANTHLLDRAFAPGLADHARNVAERFPWVEYYTPVNEPLTTARFSCLYGHWYPHRTDALSFARGLFNEIAATREAMRAIRAINPRAKLVQTEDTGKIYSTSLLAYQAAFENERRWLSFDLLCGRVNSDHPLWEHLIEIGVSPEELAPFLEDPCPPDILGINHYVTSERFLDERLENYPSHCHGGNGKHRYADVSAVHVSLAGLAGACGMVRDAWERYHLPTAITECHLGCTREEQLRWLLETWRGAQHLFENGVDIRAVTVWSLLGSFDWDSLVTMARGHYEPGAFDLRSPQPRPTAIAACMKSLNATGKFKHPVTMTDGWWRQEKRLQFPPAQPHNPERSPKTHWWPPAVPEHSRPILITGATGTLGNAFGRLCQLRGLHHRIVTRQEMDIGSEDSVRALVTSVKPWAVINTAGYVRLDDAERDRAECFRVNVLGPTELAKACAALQIPFVTFSSDLVFDGKKADAYLERDLRAPLNAYGRSKAEAEKNVLAILPNALVIRTSGFFGPWDNCNFITLSLRKMKNGQPVMAAHDSFVSPTYVPHLVHATLDLLIDGAGGIWHIANQGKVTWAQWARHAASLAGVPEDLIIDKPLRELQLSAPHPRHSALSSERGFFLPSWEDALGSYMEERSGQ